jgi:hypothetical protein
MKYMSIVPLVYAVCHAMDSNDRTVVYDIMSLVLLSCMLWVAEWHPVLRRLSCMVVLPPLLFTLMGHLYSQIVTWWL